MSRQKCYHNYTMASYSKRRIDTLSSKTRSAQHAISIYWATIFADLGNRVIRQSSFYTAISSPLPSPYTYDSLPLHIQGGHLHTICQHSHFFLRLFLLSSNEKVVEASSALYFWDHHTPIQTVYLSLANPVLKPEVCRNQGLVHHNLNSLHEMPIPQ